MEVRDETIKNRSGKRMPLTIRTPDQSIGVALVVHGMGGWRKQSVIVAAAEALAEKGYTTLTFDAADGALAPDNDFFHSTTSGHYKDLEDVVIWMKKEHSAPLVLAAHSAGALVAVRYAARHPEIAKLILLAPAISWKAGLWTQIPYLLAWLVIGRRPSWTRRPLGRAWVLDFFSYDGEREAKHILVPTLVVSAENDHTVAKPIVNRHFARRFVKGSHETIQGAPHDFLEHEKEVAATISAWLSSS